MLPYQARYVRDRSRLILVEKSRQIGFTWATAYKLVSTTSLAGAAQDDWVSSRDELQARLLIEDCQHFAALLHIGARDLGQRVVDDRRHSAYVLSYANGRRTHSLSSNPDAQAGKRGRRVLDEFALHEDPRRLYAIAYPGITWGGSMEIISTHRGSHNYFAELAEEITRKGNPKQISHHRVTLSDALDQGFLHKLQAKLPQGDERQEMDEAAYYDYVRRGCPDEETFQQEYMCQPADDAAAFLSYDLIQGCEWREGDRSDGAGELSVGVDVGRDHDLTVIWVLARLGDVFWTREVRCLDRRPFDEQEAALYGILEQPGVRRCCIDATGIGRQFAERAVRRFGRYRVEGVTFSGPVKEELAYPVRAAFEDRRLRIPADAAIRSDLRAIKKETTAAGNIRFTADRGKNGHADRFWALALALHAGKSGGGSTWASAAAVGGFRGGAW